jgi:hypothetical protein
MLAGSGGKVEAAGTADVDSGIVFGGGSFGFSASGLSCGIGAGMAFRRRVPRLDADLARAQFERFAFRQRRLAIRHLRFDPPQTRPKVVGRKIDDEPQGSTSVATKASLEQARSSSRVRFTG